jgi:chromosomal replication initiation ATPase DnaA
MNDYLAPAPFAVNHKSPREISLCIVREICQRHGIELWEILSHNRQARLVAPRFAAYAALRRNSLSPASIGDIFKRDQTTITHGIKRAKELGLC